MTSRVQAVSSWWQDRPLRSRLAAVAAVVVALAIGVAVTVAYVVVRHELLGQLDQQLRHQASKLQEQAQISRGRGFPVVQLQAEFGQPGGYVQVVNPAGETNRPSEQAVSLPTDARDRAIAATQNGSHTNVVTVGGTRVRVLTTPLLDSYAVQVALPYEPVADQLHRLALSFIALAIAALLAAIALAWWLTRTALSPVARLTETAERIAETKDLTHRISETRGDELGRLAASFNSMLDALHESESAQRQLVADASHELRTPLSSLRTNAEVLRQFDQLSPDQREEIVTSIVGQLEELTSLVADVVELARGEEPTQEFDHVALDEIVENAVLQARRHWPAVTFNLTTAPVTVRGVARRLDRAVANLLDNAAKFSGATGLVEVGLAPDGVLSVRDHGPGVAPDALPNVFDRFYRADDARGMPGSGLGLAIVKQVAESHDGTVSLANADGGGLLATLRLPTVVAPGAAGSLPESLDHAEMPPTEDAPNEPDGRVLPGFVRPPT